MMQRPFTGWHMLAMMVAFFGVVIAVNLTMARIAIGTFGGVVVENSYVASQEFNGWLDQAAAERALGWDVVTTRLDDGRVQLAVTGAPDGLVVAATARHPLGHAPDQLLRFRQAQDGTWLSASALPAGRWTLRLELASGAQHWRREDNLQ